MSGTNADTIKEFLVSLKWKTDDAAEKRAKDSVESMGKSIVALGVAIEGAALAVVAAVSRIAKQTEDLYWASQRLGSSVQGINQFTYAISQMGGSASSARSSLEGLAAFMRSSPGAGGILVGLGIDPAKLSDTVALTGELSKKFAELTQGGQYYRARGYAQVLGIDEITLQAMIRDAGRFSEEYAGMVRAVGLDQQKAAADATFFEQRLRAVGTAIDLLYQSAASRVSRGLGNSLNSFKDTLLRNADLITSAVEIAATGLLRVAMGVSQFVGRFAEILHRLYDAYKQANPQTQEFIRLLGEVIIAWKLLNTAFLRSPIGIIASLAAGLILLYDDYMTWKEGGKSLIDWEKWEPSIEKAKAAILEIIDYLNKAATAIGGWQNVALAFFALITGRWVLGIVTSMGQAALAMNTAVFGGLTKLARLATFLTGLLSALGVPLLAIAAIVWPNNSIADDEDEKKQNPGYNPAGSARPGEIHDENNLSMAQWSGVSDEKVGSLEHARNPSVNAPGFLTRLGWRMGGGDKAAFGSNIMKEVIDFFKSKGWSAAQAAGIAANLWAESKLDPHAEGDGGAAYGIGQWHPNRQEAFKRLFNKDIRQSTLGEQLTFYDWELHNTEGKAGTELALAQTPEQASNAVLGAERPAGWSPTNPGPQGPVRAGMAHDIFSLNGQPSGPSQNVASLNASPMVGNGGVQGPSPLLIPGAEGGGGGNASINQTNNFNINGADQGFGAQIKRMLDRTNGDLVRNTKNAIQ